MMPLTAPADFNAEQEANRFGWLLYGSEAEMHAIHGGCGFSKKLLHTISQITYCAARLQQEPESPFVPISADYLLQELLEMRQWTNETGHHESEKPNEVPPDVAWERAKAAPSTIEGARGVTPGWIINTHDDMTNITAEAWRFAIIIYLLCRLKRCADSLYPKMRS